MLPGVEGPIRIVHVINMLAIAGMEVGVIKLVNRQDRRKFDPMICCLRYVTEDARTLLDPRVRVVTLDKTPGVDWSMVTKLSALFRREKPHIVHSHNWPTFLYTALAAHLAGVPILIHGEHGYEDQLAIGRRLSLKRFLARGVTRLATVSSDLERVLEERWGVPPERITNIPNGVDLDRFSGGAEPDALRREFGITGQNPVILSIGRFGPVKDFPTLIRGFARLHGKRPESRLLLVGAGGPEDLRQLAESLGVGDAVLFPGQRQDVPELLTLCDVYANTSLFEGMSNTILESMALGKPVVATAVGGNPELVREGETGYLIGAGDDEALAERLERLLADPSLRERMGGAAKKIVWRDHPISKTVEAYNDLYTETWLRRRMRGSEPRNQMLRRAAAKAIRFSGLAWLRGAIDRKRLTILAYHRVLPLHASLQYAFQSMVMPRDLFEEQMAHLKRHYTVLSLADAVERLRSGDLPPRAVTVTFDDGYRDNFEFALPILKKYGISATFFVVTGALDGTARLLWDEVVTRVRELSRNGSAAALSDPGAPSWLPETVRLLSKGAAPDSVGERIVREMNRVSLDEREAAMAALRRATPKGTRQSDPVMMNWDELREMQRSGMLVGAHTVTHPFLDELSPEIARREIEESIAVLEDRIGEPVRFFSYPRGRFREDVKESLRLAGIQAAVTTDIGANAPGADPFALRRFDAGYCRIHFGHDPTLVDVEFQGWFHSLRATSYGS